MYKYFDDFNTITADTLEKINLADMIYQESEWICCDFNDTEYMMCTTFIHKNGGKYWVYYKFPVAKIIYVKYYKFGHPIKDWRERLPYGEYAYFYKVTKTYQPE